MYSGSEPSYPDAQWEQYQISKRDQHVEHILYLEKKVEALQNKLNKHKDVIKENEKLKLRIKELEELVIRLQTK
jgi:hypothetical protein